MILRRATTSDIPFIATAILNADKGISGKLSYSSIFDISEEEFTSALPEILEEDIEGQEFCLSSYCIAEIDGISAAACSSWIEDEGASSNSLKMTILNHFFPADKLQLKAGVESLLRSLVIPRTPGMLQLESVFVSPGYRGRGLINPLFDFHMKNHATQHAEVQMTSGNERAVNAYRKAGFSIKSQTSLENSLLPFNGMIVMAK